MSFVANFIRFPAVWKFWKSVKIWQSYVEFKGGNFFWDTVYVSIRCNSHSAYFTRTWLHDVPVFATANPSVCCLSGCRLSVLNVRPPNSGGWSFHRYFFTAVYRSHPLTSVQNLTEIVPRGTPLSEALNASGVAKYSDFGTVEGYITNGTRYGLGYN